MRDLTVILRQARNTSSINRPTQRFRASWICCCLGLSAALLTGCGAKGANAPRSSEEIRKEFEQAKSMLASDNKYLRLGGVGPIRRLAEAGHIDREAAIDLLVTAASDPFEGVRQQAFRSLGALRANRPDAMRVITKALEDTDPVVRRNAAEAIERIGEPIQEAMPSLLKMFSLGSASDQTAAMDALKCMDPEIIEDVAPLVGHPDPSVSDRAIMILEAQPAAPVQTALKKCLAKETNEEAREAILYALSKIEQSEHAQNKPEQSPK